MFRKWDNLGTTDSIVGEKADCGRGYGLNMV